MFLCGTALGGLADGLVDPFAAPALQRREDEAGVRAAVADVVARELLVIGQVDHAAESVLDLVEGLATAAGDGEDQRFDVRRQAGEIDRNGFVVAVTFGGKVVTAVTDRANAARSDERSVGKARVRPWRTGGAPGTSKK